MHSHPFTYHQHHFGKISIDVTQASARGGGMAPALYLPAQLQISALEPASGQQVGFLAQELSGSAVIGHAGGFSVPLTPAPIQRVIMAGSFEQFVQLVFPLTGQQIEAIEQTRTGEVSLSVHLLLHYLVLAQANAAPQAALYPPRTMLDAGLASIHANLKLPQSIWVHQVLPNLGHGQTLLLEMPAFPVSALATLGEAFEAAKRAQAMFQAGDYDVAVGLCRTAVQPLRNHLKKIKDRVGDGTAGDWAEKIGQATFEWLTIVTGKIHGVGSAALHEGSTGRFNRLDAQMILTTTFSLLAYAARLENFPRAESEQGSKA